MAQQQKNNEQERINRFDAMMFGARQPQPVPQKTKKKPAENEDFDLFGTAQTVMQTYQQLSPYVKEISNMVKKFKK
ncbi:hypothetical protein [Sediminibacillus albus]|uniref:YppG-like protein n=1 Tax=Sediminibacillus albus TaxID=407036 RepID=A0A1G8X9Y0_9BACI|nr:hypothetical protein [Sediminibacillus albus]SDJ87293.1 hypothetical protein SAMN05216243_1245 [Sediminibacillus albus]